MEDAVAFPGLNAVHFVNTPNIGTVFFGIDCSTVGTAWGEWLARRSNQAMLVWQSINQVRTVMPDRGDKRRQGQAG